jgi:AraC-like DNA-binding protein
LAKLAADPELLPAAGAEIVSPAERPLLPHPFRIGIAVVLICVGLWVLVAQVRGMSRDELARRFRRS